MEDSSFCISGPWTMALRRQRMISLPRHECQPDALVEYVDSRLRFIDVEKTSARTRRTVCSMRLIWQRSSKSLCGSSAKPCRMGQGGFFGGDVLILDRDLSCQFFFIVCRCLESGQETPTDALGTIRSALGEVTIHPDFHDAYYGKAYRMISRLCLRPVVAMWRKSRMSLRNTWRMASAAGRDKRTSIHRGRVFEQA